CGGTVTGVTGVSPPPPPPPPQPDSAKTARYMTELKKLLALMDFSFSMQFLNSCSQTDSLFEDQNGIGQVDDVVHVQVSVQQVEFVRNFNADRIAQSPDGVRNGRLFIAAEVAVGDDGVHDGRPCGHIAVRVGSGHSDGVGPFREPAHRAVPVQTVDSQGAGVWIPVDGNHRGYPRLHGAVQVKGGAVLEVLVEVDDQVRREIIVIDVNIFAGMISGQVGCCHRAYVVAVGVILDHGAPVGDSNGDQLYSGRRTIYIHVNYMVRRVIDSSTNHLEVAFCSVNCCINLQIRLHGIEDDRGRYGRCFIGKRVSSVTRDDVGPFHKPADKGAPGAVGNRQIADCCR